MLVKTHSAAVVALDAIHITVEVNVSRGMRFTMVGLPDNAVKESHERIITALSNSQLHFPLMNTVVNLAPADVKKEGAGFDLPIAVAMLAANSACNDTRLERMMLVGELGLDGKLKPVRGALSIAIKARAMHFDALIVPVENAREASVVNNLSVYGADNLRQVVDFINGTIDMEPVHTDTRAEFYASVEQFDVDFSDVKGQPIVKRALEVAAAGGHNLIMVGPPGSGKSMMAKRLPSIMPPLTLEESLETTKIHSVAGKLRAGSTLMTKRPFRSPHHTISQVALCGGGSRPNPGEISLAHNGILYCDELPEFSRTALEVLRQPLEDREIHISRVGYNLCYPCSFIFVASMNPCPCGYYGDPNHDCRCTQGQIQRYMGKISGPLLDRIDIQVLCKALTVNDMMRNTQEEGSDAIRARVIRAREIQKQRFAQHPGVYCNAQMSHALLERYAALDASCAERMRMAMERLKLSARAYDRILRVARTIADLEGNENICIHDISEAITYRNLDRASWGT